MRKLVLIMIMSATSVLHASPPYDPAEDIDALRPMFNNQMGSPEAFSTNVSQPMLNGSPMTTMDGKNKFVSRIACPNAPAFIELFALPGPHGDIETMMIRQDTDFDGVFDRLIEPGIRLSGVCANGGISCDAGTWNDCVAHQWVLQGDGSPALSPTALSNLGGCYCINNSCGTSLMISNASEVMSHLGGGLVAKMLEQNPTLAISNTQINNTIVTYTGSVTDDCEYDGETGQEALYSSPNNLKSAGKSTADSSDLYKRVTTGSFTSDIKTTSQTCSVKRNIGIDHMSATDIVLYDGGIGGVLSCGPGCLTISLGNIADNNLVGGTCGLFEEKANFWVEHPERIVSATLINAKFDDHIQISVNDSLLWSHDASWTDISPMSYPPSTVWSNGVPFCERLTSWDVSPNLDFTNAIKKYGSHEFRIRVAVSDRGEGYAFANLIVDDSCKLQQDVVSNSCQSYSSDPDCRIKHEIIDGVTTIQDFMPTGLSPLSTTQSIKSPECNLSATRTWWEKRRVYDCTTTHNYDFDDALKRNATVKSTTTNTGYDDIRKDKNGNWVSEINNELTLPSTQQMNTCEKTCKTKKTVESDSVSGMGPESSQRENLYTDELISYVCKNGDICPVGPNEVIVSACGCANDFDSATAKMQANRLAARDTVCTSGTPSPL